MESDALHTKHRPTSLKEVVGQEHTVEALGRAIENHSSHSFILSGPSGCGKTTLARIAADLLGCTMDSILEIDAATKTGVDSMRAVMEPLKYKPMGKSISKVVIVDECHMLSKSAWNSMLKTIEEPPEYVYFFFCTTEPGKVLQTVKTRCMSFSLEYISSVTLTKLVKRVARAEELDVPAEIVSLIVSEAGGSARQALVNLSTCAGVEDRAVAATLLRSAEKNDAVLALCRFLISENHKWPKALEHLNAITDIPAESVRIIIVNYVLAVLKRERKAERASWLLHVLAAFSEPYNQTDKLAPLYLSVGELVIG